MTFGFKESLVQSSDFDFLRDLAPKLSPISEDEVDLSRYSTPSQQGPLSSCAGNATADALEIVAAVEEEEKALAEGREPRPTPQVSRLFIYSMSRLLHDLDGDGQTDLNLDEGTYVRTCLDVLSRFGVCREDLWPYDTSKVFTAPSMKAMREAVGHRIHSYYRIRETGLDRLTAIETALRSKHPVIFGTKVSSAFLANSGPDTEDVPTQVEGGHAMIIVGFTSDGRYKIKNSWGESWRNKGFVYLTRDYIMWDKTTDLWVPHKGARL